MRVIPAVALLTRHAVAGRPTVWRAAEEVDTLPVGAQVTLTGALDGRKWEALHRWMVGYQWDMMAYPSAMFYQTLPSISKHACCPSHYYRDSTDTKIEQDHLQETSETSGYNGITWDKPGESIQIPFDHSPFLTKILFHS